MKPANTYLMSLIGAVLAGCGSASPQGGAPGAPEVGIVTLAPELPGGLDFVRDLVKAGHRVSLGHTGATYEEARAAIAAGAHHATHLFNRMSSLTSRSPGVVGAVLESDAVSAEVICDGYHVHPSLVSMAIRLKSPGRMMAITDGTAAAGLRIQSAAGGLARAAARGDAVPDALHHRVHQRVQG